VCSVGRGSARRPRTARRTSRRGCPGGGPSDERASLVRKGYSERDSRPSARRFRESLSVERFDPRSPIVFPLLTCGDWAVPGVWSQNGPMGSLAGQRTGSTVSRGDHSSGGVCVASPPRRLMRRGAWRDCPICGRRGCANPWICGSPRVCLQGGPPRSSGVSAAGDAEPVNHRADPGTRAGTAESRLATAQTAGTSNAGGQPLEGLFPKGRRQPHVRPDSAGRASGSSMG
jgi:hypothetical protein